jgi:uncharacterized protein (TIGR03437 family)
MGSSRISKLPGIGALTALLALWACTASLQAANLLTATPASVTVTCNTATGPGAAATIVIKPVTPLVGAATLAVSFNAPGSGIVVTPPLVTSLSTANQTAGLSYTVSTAAGCVGASTGATVVTFKAGGVSDATATVNDTVTSSASGLVAAPVTITCGKSGSSYTPGSAQTVSVSSAASGGTPFTVDTVTNAPPAWLTVTPTTGGTAGASPVAFTVAAAAGCGGFSVATSNVATLHLLNAPAPDKLVTVTLQILPPSPVVPAPLAPSLTYVKGSGTAGHVDVALTSLASPSPFFSVNTASLPIWLTVDTTTGTVPKSLRFSSTSVCDTLAPGTYTASVTVKVSGFADLSLPITLQLNNKAPRLSVAEGTTRNISWTLGTLLPTPFITAVSTDSPISYATSSGGTLAPIVSAAQQSGLAYSFGTQIGVTFNPLIFAAAQPGSVLTGTVTLTWGAPASTIVVTFNVSILSPGATVTGLTPASLPTANPGQTFTVVLTGTGFVTSTDPSQKTKVGVIVGGSIVTDTNIAVNVINPSNIILTITVPVVADANLPFAVAGTGGSVSIGICNPAGGSCTIPTGTATLTIGTGPIIQAVTSASAFTQVAPPALPAMAPYDMLSIFGANFCSSGGTGCSSSQILYGAPDATLRYPASLSPDTAGATQRFLSVVFQTHGGSPSPIATAPLLFATNGQINLLVPAALSAYIGSSVDLVVNFGYGTGATLKSSNPFQVNITATNPGLFTVGANGQGDGAILNSSYAQVTGAAPAGMRSTATDSDTVQFYLTGLGSPDSVADNASAGTSFAWAADCITVASYLTSLNSVASSALSNVDGTVMQSWLFNTNRLPPCVRDNSANVPSVTIGGVAGTVVYAGFVPDTVAGLYQINVTLPSTTGAFTTAAGASLNAITAPVQLPVVVTANGVSSQSGVTMWVAPRLKVTGPSGAGLTGTVGVPWSSSNNVVVAAEGTSAYRYALTSGLLPSGLTLNALTGVIGGTPAANSAGSYMVTVTATDSANVPVTGTVSFTLTVAGGLFLTSSGTAPYNGTFGTANANLTRVTAAGGVFPYAYAITTPGTLPAGMTINASTGIVGITALTPAGTYHVTVTSTDSTAGTPLTGTITFDIVVSLHLTKTSTVSGTHGVASTITTITAAGGTGTITYSLDAATLALPNGWVTIDSSTGAVSITTGAVAAASTSVTVTATDGSLAPNAATAATGTITFTFAVN